jgi:hypothetical protein
MALTGGGSGYSGEAEPAKASGLLHLYDCISP